MEAPVNVEHSAVPEVNDSPLTLSDKVDDLKIPRSVENRSENEVIVEEDPYAYLSREDFTSEKFKIEIRGLPKFYGRNELKKLINEKLSLGSAKIKSLRPGNPWAFICFRNEEDRAKAITVLNEYVWKGKKLTAKEAQPAPDPLVKKRKQDAESNSANPKRTRPDDDVAPEEKLKNSTTPYWNVPYEEQLVLKQKDVHNVLKKFAYDLYKWGPDTQKWIEEQKKIHNGLVCELQQIKASPCIDGYRNKCEFTVGIGSESKLPTVGFRLGSYAMGFTEVGPVQSLKHIPEKMKLAVQVYEGFVRKSSLTVFSPEDHSGHFRQLTARLSTATQQLMLIVGIHPQDLDELQLSAFKQDLRTFFSEGDGKQCDVTSLYYEAITKRSSGQTAPAIEHLMGETHINEVINGLTFRISPEAFFQINTPSAEVLYNAAIELGLPTLDTTMLDVCCGTGSIALCFAKHCYKVLGIEIVPQAVLDADNNAKANGITNAEFISGAAEDLLRSVLWKIQNEKDLLAVVDPPRAGLHIRAITQIRACAPLKRLVYISCNPNQALKNWVDLCRPESKTMRGEPFVPVKAVAVDLFPHTKHCELVLYFERVVAEENINTNPSTNEEVSEGLMQTAEVSSVGSVDK